MELELKHFESYGLGLQVVDDNHNVYDYLGCSHINKKLFIKDAKGKYFVKPFKEFIPVLKSKSEIITLNLYDKLFPVDDVEFEVFGKTSLELAKEFINDDSTKQFFRYEDWRILLDNQIDFYNLIENGLAIEIEVVNEINKK